MVNQVSEFGHLHFILEFESVAFEHGRAPALFKGHDLTVDGMNAPLPKVAEKIIKESAGAIHAPHVRQEVDVEMGHVFRGEGYFRPAFYQQPM